MAEVAVLADLQGRFSIHVISYGVAKKRSPIKPHGAFNAKNVESTI